MFRITSGGREHLRTDAFDEQRLPRADDADDAFVARAIDGPSSLDVERERETRRFLVRHSGRHHLTVTTDEVHGTPVAEGRDDVPRQAIDRLVRAEGRFDDAARFRDEREPPVHVGDARAIELLPSTINRRRRPTTA